MAAIAKLAAWLYRRTKLSWGHALGYVLLIVVGTAALGVLHRLGGATTPLPLLVAASLAFQLMLGGWYLGRNARGADGGQLTFPRGAILAALNFGVLLAIMIAPALVFLALRP